MCKSSIFCVKKQSSCEEWLNSDRCKAGIENRVPICTIDSKLSEFSITKGIKFIAKDSFNRRINYSYQGYGDLTNICFSIHLKNLDDGSDTYVEPTWFDNREITIL